MEEDVIASIRRVLLDYFSNLEEVQKSDRQWSNCRAAVKHALDSLKRHPQILLKCDDKTKDFPRWLFVQLLRIMGEPRCADIHSEILQQLENMLIEFRRKNYPLYKEVVQELATSFIEAANIRYQMEDATGDVEQCGLLLFTGKESVVPGKSPNIISLSDADKCDAVISTTASILNLFYHCGFGRGKLHDMLNACGQSIEVCKPEIKSSCLKLAGSLFLLEEPDPATEPFNYILDLALFLCSTTDTVFMVSTTSGNLTRLLMIILTGSQSWLRPRDGYMLPWICANNILEKARLVLEGNCCELSCKLCMVRCVQFIYTLWDVVAYEDSSLRPQPDKTAAFVGTRTTELMTLLVDQIGSLGCEAAVPGILALLDASGKRLNIGQKALMFTSLSDSINNYNATAASVDLVEKKIPRQGRGLQSIGHALRLLDGIQLQVVEQENSLDDECTAFESFSVLWKCLVHVALTQAPHITAAVRAKATDVMELLDTIKRDNKMATRFIILGHTLLLFYPDKEQLPARIRHKFEKQLMEINITALSEKNRRRVLHCCVLLGSQRNENLHYFVDPLSNSTGSASVLPLIQLLPQLKRAQVINCVERMVENTNPDQLVEVASFLDQIVLACVGKSLRYTPAAKITEHDLFASLKYDEGTAATAEEVKCSPSISASICKLFNDRNPVQCLLKSLGHVKVLSKYICQEELVAVLVPLILHPDSVVRAKVARNSLYDIGELSPTPTTTAKLSDIQRKVVLQLKQTLDAKPDEYKKTAIICAVSLARNADFMFTKELVPALMCGVLDHDDIRPDVMKGLENIAKNQGMNTLSEFAHRYKATISEITISKILRQPELIQSFMEDVSGTFFGEKQVVQRQVGCFLTKSLQYFLPIVVMYGGQSPDNGKVAKTILGYFSQFLNQTVKRLVVTNFVHIFCFIARSHKQQDAPFAFITNVSGMTLSELMEHNIQPIYNHLILYLSRDRDAVVWGLNMLAANTSKDANRRTASNQDEVLEEMLEPRLLGVLVFFSSIQLARLTEDSFIVLENVIQLMQIMQPDKLYKWKDKIISILRTGMTSPDTDIQQDALQAWDKFVRLCEGKCIGPLVGEIVAILLPHVDAYPAQVCGTVAHLLVERWPKIKENVGDIGWLDIPDHPGLVGVKTYFNKQAKTGHGTKLTEDAFKARLWTHIEGIGCESCEVRAHTLQSLEKLLHDNQQVIHHIVLGRETVDAVIGQLISVLLAGVKDPDPETRLLFCTCLGEIGAIDEGLLGSVISTETSKHKVFLNGIEDEDFGPELLIVLTKGYRNSSDQQSEDKYAFAIQEILSAYRQCGDVLFKKFGAKFDEGVMEILEPHKNSKYVLKSHHCPEMVSPVFKSDGRTSLKSWLTTCTCLLLKIVSSSHTLASLLIEPLKIITSAQTDTLQFLLPVLVLQILMKGDAAAQQFVLTEIQAVLYATQNSAVKCDVTRMIAQTIFSLIDYIMIWINKKRGCSNTTELKRVEKTLDKVHKQAIAVSAFNCGAYNRALMYLEYKKKVSDTKDWQLLQQIYVQMSVFDGVAGVTASRSTPASLKEQIESLETGGKLQDTEPMYEEGITRFPEDMFFVRGRLKRMLDVGNLTALLPLVNWMVQEQPQLTASLNEYRVQAAWSLARWDIMEGYLTTTDTSWAAGVGRQFLAARQMNKETFTASIRSLRQAQLVPLSAAAMEGGCYDRCYENILNLHMLRDLEEWANCLLFHKPDFKTIKRCTEEFESRIAVIQDGWGTREPVYNLQRALLNLVSGNNNLPDNVIKGYMGNSWLNSATLARKDLLMLCCGSALQNASLYSPSQFKIERARWLWDKSEQEEAMALLKHYVSDLAPHKDISNRGRAEASLLYANWCEETAYFDSAHIQHLFQKVKEIDSHWEEAHFSLANYYYKWQKAVADTSLKQSMIPHIVKHYGESLKYGSNNIFQSMPRLLTTWFELEGTNANHVSSSQAAKKPNILEQTNVHMTNLIKTLPSYQWLTALSQILSRICHPSTTVSQKLVEISSLVLYHYPQQALWQIYGSQNNSNKERSTCCRDIIKETAKKYKRPVAGCGVQWFQKFYSDFDRLCKGLFEISSKDSGNQSKLSVNKDFRFFKKMLEEPNFCRIILPIQRNTTVTLPVGSGPHAQHNAFPHDLVTISSLRDEVLVLTSLQRPKKITVLGSNGKWYGLLVKPKDDLRKDCRFMEFSTMVNRLLKKDATARKKQLHIRTYAVVPLSENSGIVEWVDHTKLLRVILHGLYSQTKMGITRAETANIFKKMQHIKQHTSSKQKIQEHIDLFQNVVLPRHPPVLSEWFRYTFPDPSCWFTARQNYTQTTAVVSMVGYVVGLGDRHSENIMFDYTTGETVHVDFDCLFEKGKSFDWPELVPFRLTHNMVDAFGLTGVEGMFRLSCVVAMRVMRNERESLISVLKTFVHDPLVEWAKQERGRVSQGHRARQNVRADANSIMKDKAQEIMKTIEEKLNGQMGQNAHAILPISTEGQVQKLIGDSIDLANLSQMYIGWAPYY